MSEHPLHRLFSELNAEFWKGRLPTYRVRRRRLPALEGWCDVERRVITIDPRRVSPDDVRKTLLHEMCHAATRGGGGHGKRFLAELARLAAAGEKWAEEERQIYADPARRIRATRHSIREHLEDLLRVDKPGEIEWRRARAYTAHWFGMSQPEFSERFPWARAFFLRKQRAEIADREQERALDERLKQEHPELKAWLARAQPEL